MTTRSEGLGQLDDEWQGLPWVGREPIPRLPDWRRSRLQRLSSSH